MMRKGESFYFENLPLYLMPQQLYNFMRIFLFDFSPDLQAATLKIAMVERFERLSRKCALMRKREKKKLLEPYLYLVATILRSYLPYHFEEVNFFYYNDNDDDEQTASLSTRCEK